MKNRIVLALICMVLPSVSFANCGYVPEPPELLEEAQLTSDQLIGAGDQMSTYFDTVSNFKECVDGLISTLAPADATEEYFMSTQYQTDFQNLFNFNELADQKVTSATERYNYLIEVATGE